MKNGRHFLTAGITLFLLVLLAFTSFHIFSSNGENSTPSDSYILVDHNAVSEFDKIPEQWLNAAKKLVVHYGHTSHGSQILSGLVILHNLNSTKYSMNIKDEGNAQAGITQTMPADKRIPVGIAPGGETTLRITREGAWHIGYWSTEAGLEGTRNVLKYKNGLFDVSGWAWCGELASKDDQIVHTYLRAMENLEKSFPAIRFFYMTGHVDPGNNNVKRHNEMIREYCRKNNKILYDFADIESWDLDGNFHSNASPDCKWCETWCRNPAHADHLECKIRDTLPPNSDDCCGGAGCGNIRGCKIMCPHTDGINCLIKGKAFWWMIARIAGWNGT